MSLSALETALVEFVGQTIVDDCGLASPEVLRYHGGPVPDDCCTDDGVLSVWWERLYRSSRFPGADTANPCAGMTTTILRVRYSTCWPTLQVAPGGAPILDFAGWDARAAVLADLADCVERALLRLSCDPNADDPFVAAVLAEAGRVRWFETIPSRPSGGCTSITWAVYAAVLHAAVPS